MKILDTKRKKTAFFIIVPLAAVILIAIGWTDFFGSVSKDYSINHMRAHEPANGISAGGTISSSLGRFYSSGETDYYVAKGGSGSSSFYFAIAVTEGSQKERLDKMEKYSTYMAVVKEPQIISYVVGTQAAQTTAVAEDEWVVAEEAVQPEGAETAAAEEAADTVRTVEVTVTSIINEAPPMGDPIEYKGVFDRLEPEIEAAYYEYLSSRPEFEEMPQSSISITAVPYILNYRTTGKLAICFYLGLAFALLALLGYYKMRGEDVISEESASVGSDDDDELRLQATNSNYIALQATINKLKAEKAMKEAGAVPTESGEDAKAVPESKAAENTSVPAAAAVSLSKEASATVLGIFHSEDDEEDKRDGEAYESLMETMKKLREEKGINTPVITRLEKSEREVKLTPFGKINDPKEGKRYADLQETIIRLRAQNPHIGELEDVVAAAEPKKKPEKKAELSPQELEALAKIKQPPSFEELVGDTTAISEKPTKGKTNGKGRSDNGKKSK